MKKAHTPDWMHLLHGAHKGYAVRSSVSTVVPAQQDARINAQLSIVMPAGWTATVISHDHGGTARVDLADWQIATLTPLVRNTSADDWAIAEGDIIAELAFGPENVDVD